jgi:hypothetical protein
MDGDGKDRRRWERGAESIGDFSEATRAISDLRDRWQVVLDTWVTLFAFGREVLMPWRECSVTEELLRFVARLLER